jgi:hypothetical protein
VGPILRFRESAGNTGVVVRLMAPRAALWLGAYIEEAVASEKF